jgi:hypothetical protein
MILSRKEKTEISNKIHKIIHNIINLMLAFTFFVSGILFRYIAHGEEPVDRFFPGLDSDRQSFAWHAYTLTPTLKLLDRFRLFLPCNPCRQRRHWVSPPPLGRSSSGNLFCPILINGMDYKVRF